MRNAFRGYRLVITSIFFFFLSFSLSFFPQRILLQPSKERFFTSISAPYFQSCEGIALGKHYSIKKNHLHIFHHPKSIVQKKKRWFDSIIHDIKTFLRKIFSILRSIFRMKDHKPTKVTENVTALRPTFPTSSEEEELQERLESPNEETNEVLVNEDEAPPTKEEIHGMKDPAHEAYLHSIRVEQQKHYVENVLKDIARMKERYKDLTGNFTVNNSTLGIIDTSTNATSVLGLLNEKVEILDTTSSSPSQTQVEAADDTRKEKKIHKEEKYSNLSKSVQRFVGLWQLAEERFRNESFLSADRLFDTIEIPPYGAVISSLNGSTGLDWYVNYLNASEGGKQQPILNFKVLRGCSSTSWIRISDSKTKLVVTRPPKPPYDQLPRICLYRGTVVEDRIIGFVYSKDDQSIQDDKFYLLDLSNSSSGYSQIGNFHMYRI